MRNRFGDPYTITATHTVSSTGHPVTVGKYATADGTFRPVDSNAHETAEALAGFAKRAGRRIDKVTVQRYSATEAPSTSGSPRGS